MSSINATQKIEFRGTSTKFIQKTYQNSCSYLKITNTSFFIRISFIRPQFDYGKINSDQLYNEAFHKKFESIQYNACLAITGVIKSTTKKSFTKN